jgi:hypothetical protein
MLSPLWMKKSGRSRRMVSKMRMPPKSGLMPQPWPATSPDHTKRMSRARLGAAPGATSAGVSSEPASGSLASAVSRRSSNVTR